MTRSTSPPPRVVAFCASHLSSARRVALLQCAIDSVRRQARPTSLYLSASYEPELANWAALVAGPAGAGAGATDFLLRPGRLSQFQHLALLVDRVPEAQREATWVMFCDDDDFSHPRRSAVFADLIESAAPGCDAVACRRMARPKVEPPAAASATAATAAASRQIREYAAHAGLHTLQSCSLQENLMSASEYVVYCVRLPLLVRFLAFLRRHDALDHSLCDVVFAAMVANLPSLHGCTCGRVPIGEALPKDHPAWLYAYSARRDASRVSTRCGLTAYYDSFLVRKPRFFPDLAAEFGLGAWRYSGVPGDSGVFHEDDVRRVYKAAQTRLERLGSLRRRPAGGRMITGVAADDPNSIAKTAG
jgi:hypothetical protein